jgi:hypothetical protein
MLKRSEGEGTYPSRRPAVGRLINDIVPAVAFRLIREVCPRECHPPERRSALGVGRRRRTSQTLGGVVAINLGWHHQDFLTPLPAETQCSENGSASPKANRPNSRSVDEEAAKRLLRSEATELLWLGNRVGIWMLKRSGGREANSGSLSLWNSI